MPFYIRKAFKFGPFRFNLSKSGVGASVGVKGLRVGEKPDGQTYLHAGREGLYFRENLGNKSSPMPSTPEDIPPPPGEPTFENGQYIFPVSWTPVDISRWKIQQMRGDLRELDQDDEDQKKRSPEEREKWEAASIEAFGPNWKERQRAENLQAIATHEKFIGEQMQKGRGTGCVVTLGLITLLLALVACMTR